MNAPIRTTTESFSNRVPYVQLDSHFPPFLSDKIDELIEKFASGFMKAYDASSAAAKIMRDITVNLLEQDHNLPLIREWLCRLLKLNIPIEFYEKGLQIAYDIQDRRGAAISFTNLGITYEALPDLQKPEGCFRHSIRLFSALQNKLRNNINERSQFSKNNL